MFPKPDKKTGKITIVPDTIIRIKKHIIEEAIKTKELRNESPQLVVDVFNSTATLNDEQLDLNPSKEESRKNKLSGNAFENDDRSKAKDSGAGIHPIKY